MMPADYRIPLFDAAVSVCPSISHSLSSSLHPSIIHQSIPATTPLQAVVDDHSPGTLHLMLEQQETPYLPLFEMKVT
jgi:hypothetical protein